MASVGFSLVGVVLERAKTQTHTNRDNIHTDRQRERVKYAVSQSVIIFVTVYIQSSYQL